MTHLLVTGGNRGLGRAMAQAALNRGWTVTATTRGAAVPTGARSVRLDVTDTRAVAQLTDALAPVDILINNAGILGPERQAPLAMDFDGFAHVLAVNTLAPLAVAQAVLPVMTAGGRILSISSQMAWMGYAKSDRIAYRASKVALNKVMQGLATDLALRGICVALVDPGWVRTDMGGPEADQDAPEVAAGILDLAAGLTIDRTGRFFRWDGTERPF